MLGGFLATVYGQAPPPINTRVPAAQRAVLLNKVSPEYSPEARAAGLQGSVILCLDISATGVVEEIHVVQRLGFGLDEKAIEAAKQWQFKPAMVDGKPAGVKQSVEVSFALNPARPWRVTRASYQVTRSGTGSVQSVSKAVLSQYAAPDDAACHPGTGPVLAEVAIGKDGTAGDIRFIGEHDEAAGKAVAAAISRWSFQPGSLNGEPREGTGTFAMECRGPDAGAGGPADAAATPAPMRVGGSVSAPVLLSKVEPEYSEEARAARLQGTVVLDLEVDPSGRATDLLIVHPLGLGLDENAMEGLSQWRFQPGTKGGVQVTVLATIRVIFKLL
jgi:TonB family protein